jgi:hypothetical protein
MGFVDRPRRVVPSGPGLNNTAATGNRLSPGPRAGVGRELHGPRSAELRKAVTRLDATTDPAALRELGDWISEQYAREFGAVPLGFVALCRLGPPYVDHQLSLTQRIVEHFSRGDRMPDPFQAARMLVRSGAYEYVEVFTDGPALPVQPDGSVVPPRP